MNDNTCPDATTLRELIAGTLPSAETRSLEAHLDSCVACQRQLELLSEVTSANLFSDTTLVGRASAPLKKVIDVLKHGSSGSKKSVTVDLNGLVAPATTEGTIGQLDEFDVLEVIGQGGMGLVVKAHDRSLDRTVAIKLLLPELATRRDSRERFIREAKAAASIQHPHVVTVHAVSESGSTPYLVMEYVNGETLTELLAREGALSYDIVTQIALDILKGLDAAHRRGLIHRDIKPANVLVDAETKAAKITDFGLVKAMDEDRSLTVSGTIAGTPEFMSPEQATAQLPLDARSDLFSLGTLLYLALAGSSPFLGSNTVATLRRVCDERHRPLHEAAPNVPKWLAGIVHRLLEKSPDLRYQAANQVIDDIQAGLAAPDSLQSPGNRDRRWFTARGVLLASVALVALVAWGNLGRHRDLLKTEGFSVIGSEIVHESLAASLGAAVDGDIIEVHGNREYSTECLTIWKKGLTIRAARNSLPTIVMLPGQTRVGPAITSNGGLTIEGLQFKWTGDAPNASSLDGCVVAAPTGELNIANCAFETQGRCAGLGIRGAATVLKCGFQTPDSSGVLYLPAANSRMVIEECTFDGRVAIGVATNDNLQSTVDLRMIKNTVRSDTAIQMLPSDGTSTLLEVYTRGNQFFVQSHFFGYSGLRRPGATHRMLAGIKRRFAWRLDEGNEYGTGVPMLVLQQRSGEVAYSIADDKGWREFWGL